MTLITALITVTVIVKYQYILTVSYRWEAAAEDELSESWLQLNEPKGFVQPAFKEN